MSGESSKELLYAELTGSSVVDHVVESAEKTTGSAKKTESVEIGASHAFLKAKSLLKSIETEKDISDDETDLHLFVAEDVAEEGLEPVDKPAGSAEETETIDTENSLAEDGLQGVDKPAGSAEKTEMMEKKDPVVEDSLEPVEESAEKTETMEKKDSQYPEVAQNQEPVEAVASTSKIRESDESDAADYDIERAAIRKLDNSDEWTDDEPLYYYNAQPFTFFSKVKPRPPSPAHESNDSDLCIVFESAPCASKAVQVNTQSVSSNKKIEELESEDINNGEVPTLAVSNEKKKDCGVLKDFIDESAPSTSNEGQKVNALSVSSKTQIGEMESPDSADNENLPILPVSNEKAKDCFILEDVTDAPSASKVVHQVNALDMSLKEPMETVGDSENVPTHAVANEKKRDCSVLEDSEFLCKKVLKDDQ